MKEHTSKHRESARSGGLASPTPAFDVELIRSVRALAAIPRLSSVFGGAIGQEALTVADAQKDFGTKYGEFTATPIFLTAGWRNVPSPVYHQDIVRQMGRSFAEVGGRSAVETVIGEACRNVGQHGGRDSGALRHGMARFGPGGIFMKHLVCKDSSQSAHGVLLCMVADEGSGIANPSLSLIDGVGGMGGEDHRGMGIELAGSLLTLIKSNEGRWFLYDGLNHNRNVNAPCAGVAQGRIPRSQWVKPLAEVELPKGEKGCQKIFLFAHQQADRQFLFQEAVSALTMSTTPTN